MAANAATRKPRATKPRETAAQKRDRLAAAEQSAAPEREHITPLVDRLTKDAPEVAGGAIVVDSKDAVPEERETLFVYDGAGYTIPKKLGLAASLSYTNVARVQGQAAALDWAMEQALGTVGYAVLRTAKGITDAQIERCIDVVIGRYEGAADPK